MAASTTSNQLQPEDPQIPWPSETGPESVFTMAIFALHTDVAMKLHQVIRRHDYCTRVSRQVQGFLLYDCLSESIQFTADWITSLSGVARSSLAHG